MFGMFRRLNSHQFCRTSKHFPYLLINPYYKVKLKSPSLTPFKHQSALCFYGFIFSDHFLYIELERMWPFMPNFFSFK